MYPDKFCKLVCETAMKEKLKVDMQTNTLGRMAHDWAKQTEGRTAESCDGPSVAAPLAVRSLVESDIQRRDELYGRFEFYDDITLKPLNHKLAVQARKLDIEFFSKMKVYDRVLRS